MATPKPPKPFDPKDPSTWPKLDPKRLAELQAKAGYKPLTGKKPTGTPVQPDTNMYNAGTMDVLRGAGNALIKAGDFVFKEPAKSAMRTLSTQNIQTALNPRSTATQRINAIGEDLMNVASFLPGAKAGLNFADDALRNLALRKSIKQASVPNIYEYGLHVSERPNIGNYVDPDLYKNRGGAGDALPGYAYQWRLSDPKSRPGFSNMSNQGVQDAYDWSNRLEQWKILDNDNITTYLTRGNPAGVIDDANLAGQLANGRNRGAAVPSKLEIMDKATVRNMSLEEDQQEYLKQIQDMVNANRRKITDNNRRLYYDALRRGANKPAAPDWSSLTPDEAGFATILNRNTPAEEVKRKYIQHNLEMEKSLNQGMRDIAGAMAERSGMDVTRAYDFAEDYQKWQRRGGRNPGSN